MRAAWRDHWVAHADLRVKSGAQGRSLVVTRIAAPHDTAFLKEVASKDPRRRGRFAREVRVYETLDHPGIPGLIEHNAGAQHDIGESLYLVLEFVPGGTLDDYVRANGPVSFSDAAQCISQIGKIVGALHKESVTHRDLKPANIVLRQGRIDDPVVVDFGLSFAEEEADDGLTRTNEAVGNRFLSLPEQLFGGRDPASDVTQLAGILLFVLTGLHPRSLVDGSGNKPHQSEDAREQLKQVLPEASLLRLLSCFDRAFALLVVDRYQAMDDLLSALADVTKTAEPLGDYQSLRARLEQAWLANDGPRLEEIHKTLETARQVFSSTLKPLGRKGHVFVAQSNQSSSTAPPVPFFETSYSLGFEPGPPYDFVVYRLEMRGPADFVALIEGTERWRGDRLDDPALAEAIGTAALSRLLGQEP